MHIWSNILLPNSGVDDSDVEKIIEYMEIHKIFGIKHVILYDLVKPTKGVRDVIKYYKDIGFLSKSQYHSYSRSIS